LLDYVDGTLAYNAKGKGCNTVRSHSCRLRGQVAGRH
jgi:hypothetical protein